MRALVTCCAAASIIASLAPRPAVAQNTLPLGTWRGWLQQPDQDSIRVSYVVQKSGKHILITMTGRSGIAYDMSDAKVKNDVLTFDWVMGLGSSLYCRLTRRDGKSFEGLCNDRTPGQTGKGVRVWMMMTPTDSIPT
jgi:hypothetical protein